MKHLTVEQRYKIWAMLQQGFKQKDYFSKFVNKLIKYDKTRYCYHTY
ncbi:MAG: hypothetical protein PWQ14_1407 [Rikenellaceae bacterium]|jgi:hypothetical protein|nr:hypothetical protein [Rikenellaceae bacterium]